jgi:hypothetical protein
MNFELTYRNPAFAYLRGWLLAVIGILAAAGLPYPQALAGETNDAFSAWPQVPDSELATMRGGFITSDGLNISIGLEQVVMIDGEIKVKNNFNLTDLGQAQSPGAANNKMINLVQNGDKNAVSPDVQANFGNGSLTLIQNSLDDQRIQNLNLLKIDVSGISRLRNSIMDSNLGLQVIRSLR